MGDFSTSEDSRFIINFISLGLIPSKLIRIGRYFSSIISLICFDVILNIIVLSAAFIMVKE